MKKISKEIYNIELKNIDGKDIDATLVLEGGAFRGLYTSGVLDCLLDNDILINKVIGISAGGLNGVNYLAGCRGRAAYCVLRHRFNKRYVGAKAYKESGSIVGFKYMFEDLNNDLKLRENIVFNKTLIVGCCNCDTGLTEYIKVDNHDIMLKAIKASASMPIVSKMVDINGSKYLDGGSNEKLPIRYAINNNYKKIIFVGTRPIWYRRSESHKVIKVAKAMYHNYPKFIEALANTNTKYNQDVDYIEELKKQGKLITITPSKYIKVSRLEKDVKKLRDLYDLGYSDCLNQLPEIKEYLKIK